MNLFPFLTININKNYIQLDNMQSNIQIVIVLLYYKDFFAHKDINTYINGVV